MQETMHITDPRLLIFGLPAEDQAEEAWSAYSEGAASYYTTLWDMA